MSLFENMAQFFEKTPEVGPTKTDSYGARNSLPEQENPDKAVERRYFEWATGRMREAIRRIYADFFDRTGIADISRQLKFMLATQTMLSILLESLLLASKPELDPNLIKPIQREIKQIGKKLKIIHTTELNEKPNPDSKTVYIIVGYRAQGDNKHFSIKVVFNGEEIFFSPKISREKQDEKLRELIIRAVNNKLCNNSPKSSNTENQVGRNCRENPKRR